MHPLNPQKYLGPNGIAVTYYNGTSTVNGYIVKQRSANKFDITDGTNLKQALVLAPNTAIASSINSSNAAYFTIPVHPYNTVASGGTLAPHYGVDSAAVVNSTTTSTWNVGDSLALPSGAGALTVASLNSGNIATVTVGNAGSYTALFTNPVTCTRAAGTGATFTAHYGLDSATLQSAGSGYAATNVLTLGSSGSATITVDTVDGSGHILTFHVSAVGSVTSLPSNPVSVTGGAGTGATFNLKWKVLSVTSSGGTGYNVGDTLTFNGMSATVAPTAHVSVATSHAATTVSVDTAGSGITVAATSITTSTTTATFNLKYNLVSVSSSGGTGYAVNDTLLFSGIVADVIPSAHISTATSGAATAVTVDTAGSGITVAATSVTVSGVTEHVLKINEGQIYTTEGNGYTWAVGGPNIEKSAYLPRYSDVT